MLDGISVEEAEKRFKINILEYFKKNLNKLEDLGLIEIIDQKQVKLSKKGLDLANIVWEEFV